MTETTTSDPQSKPGPDTGTPFHPADILLNLIVTLLAPMFLCASEGDIRFARMAAMETVNGYRAQNHAGLIAVAQIVAFGLAALGSLSLSMADDLSVSMTLRLRGNANALNRSAEQNRRALTRPHADDAMPRPNPAASIDQEDHPQKTEAQKATPAPISNDKAPIAAKLLTPQQQQQNRSAWATAITGVAKEFTDSLPFLPPTERKLTESKIAAMGSSVAALLSGKPLPNFRAGPLAGITQPAKR
jgi:hypothetical protein